MIGNEEDFIASLGFEVEGADEHLPNVQAEDYEATIKTAARTFPNFRSLAPPSAQRTAR